MNNTIVKSLYRSFSSPAFLSPAALSSTFRPTLATSRPIMTTSSRTQAEAVRDMDKGEPEDEDHEERTRDLMRHSFGEGYATRADEEGFGVIYKGNLKQAGSNIRADEQIHESTEVKEKKKAPRH